jgi:hypothetical protein
MLDIISSSSPSAIPLKVTGQAIAKSHWSPRRRAFLAAKWHSGQVTIEPTVKLAAEVFGVSVLLVNAAIADAEYKRWLSEQDSPSESLTEHLKRSTPDEWLEAARAIGPAAIWDRMIAPIL